MRLHLRYLIISACLLVPTLTAGQSDNNFAGLVTYIDAFNLSVDAEYSMFSSESWHVNIHTGYGGFHLSNENPQHQWIPLNMVVFYGNKSSHVEATVGLAYARGHEYVISPYYPNKAVYLTTSLGYRLQPPTRGFFLRLAYQPLFKLKELSEMKNTQTFTHAGVIGIGYFFGR